MNGNTLSGLSYGNQPLQTNNEWLPELLNGVKHKLLSSTVSERWLHKLAVVEKDFYGDIVQQYSASFPRAFKPSVNTKPEHTSNWGANTTVATTQMNWNRVYGIDIDKSELSKFTDNREDYEAFLINCIQEGINFANLEEILLVEYGVQKDLETVKSVTKDDVFSELLAEVNSHLGYIKNESLITADDEVVILCDYATEARLKSLPSLRYVDRNSRERVLEKIVPVPTLPTLYVTTNQVTVTREMIRDHVLTEDVAVGTVLPVGTLITNTLYFNEADYKPILTTQDNKVANILVYDKRNILVNERPTLYNWENIEGEINFNFQDFQRGLVGQNTLNRNMNVAFCNLFRSAAFRFDA